MSSIKPDNHSKPAPRSPDTCQAVYWHPVLYRWMQCSKRKSAGDYCAQHRQELTCEEREIIAALAEGQTTKLIALERGKTALWMSRKIRRACQVVGAETTAQLIAMYIREELQVEAKTIEA